MSAFIAMVLASIPNAILAIAGKLLTEKFMQSVLEKVLVTGLKKAAAMSTNTIDDDVVEDIKRRLSEPVA